MVNKTPLITQGSCNFETLKVLFSGTENISWVSEILRCFYFIGNDELAVSSTIPD